MRRLSRYDDPLFVGTDKSSQRHCFGNKVREVFGYVEMYFDGARVYRWDGASMALTVTNPLKPSTEMGAANPTNGGYVSWAGKSTGMTAKYTPLVIFVHGNGYSTNQ